MEELDTHFLKLDFYFIHTSKWIQMDSVVICFYFLYVIISFDEIIKAEITASTVFSQRGLFQMSNARNRRKKKVTDVSSKFLKIKTSDCQENKKLTKITRNKWQAGENSLSYFNKKKDKHTKIKIDKSHEKVINTPPKICIYKYIITI